MSLLNGQSEQYPLPQCMTVSALVRYCLYKQNECIVVNMYISHIFTSLSHPSNEEATFDQIDAGRFVRCLPKIKTKKSVTVYYHLTFTYNEVRSTVVMGLIPMCDWWKPSGAAFQPNARCIVSQGECACLKLPLELHAVILTFSAGMESTLISDIFLPCLKFTDGNTVH